MAATVRIKAGTHAPVILEKAIECFRRQRFLVKANRSYAALRKKPKEWKEEAAERREWEATLKDGLEDD